MRALTTTDDDIADSNKFDRAAYHLLREARDNRAIQKIAYDWLVSSKNECTDPNVIRSIDLMVKCVSDGKVEIV